MFYKTVSLAACLAACLGAVSSVPPPIFRRARMHPRC